MKQPHQIEQELIDTLEQLPVEFVLASQCASLCSCFISGSYISATSSELLNELVARHKGELDKKSAKQIIDIVLQFGVDTGMLVREPDNKYSPTEVGWFVGEDWNKKIKQNDFSVGI